MKNFIVPLLVLLLLNACASQTKSSNKMEMSDSFLLTSTSSKTRTVTGKTAHIEMLIIEGQIYPEIIGSISTVLKEKGYQIVEDPVDAYIDIRILNSRKPLDEIFDLTKEQETTSGEVEIKWVEQTPFKERTFHFKGPSNTMMETFTITVDVQEYGKRPLTIATGRLIGPNDGTLIRSDSLANLLHFASYQIPMPGSKSLEFKKRPGCVPRFGMEYDSESNIPNLVKLFQKNSPAAKAGMKIGDQVLAIDTYDLDEMNTQKGSEAIDQIYEEQKMVPVKVQRGKKIFYLNIKPSIMCAR